MQIRDRIKELRRVPASELRPHARNWRTHPQAQRDALRGLLAEVGYAGALLARELPGGGLELIDGHLRAETTPDGLLPVLVLDVSEAEALKLLAAYDPVGGLADRDQAVLESVLAEVDTQSPALRQMFDALLERDAEPQLLDAELPDHELPAESYEVLVACRDEDEQRRVYELLSAQGLKCRLLNL